MKKIQGKVLFLVVPVNIQRSGILEIPTFLSTEDKAEVIDKYYNKCVSLSKITQKQAGELVEAGTVVGVGKNKTEPCGFVNYGFSGSSIFNTPKESLVSLLKANDCWTKEMRLQFIKNKARAGRCVDLFSHNKLPDDFLIIKLK